MLNTQLAFAAFTLVAIIALPSHGGACDKKVTPATGTAAYRSFGNYCEGLYSTKHSLTSIVRLIALSRGSCEMKAQSTGLLNVSWSNAGGGKLQIAADGVHGDRSWRMDAEADASALNFAWPQTNLKSAGFPPKALGVTATTTRGQGPVHIPVTFGQCNSANAYEFVFVTEYAIKQLNASLLAPLVGGERQRKRILLNKLIPNARAAGARFAVKVPLSLLEKEPKGTYTLNLGGAQSIGGTPVSSSIEFVHE